MGLLTDVMRALIAAGATPEQLLAASEAAEASMQAEQAAAAAETARRDEERREKRREGNRLRQARYYDRHFRDNAANAVIARDNAPNAVMRREEREDLAAKGPQTPKTNPQDSLISSLPSEAQVLSPAKPRRNPWPDDFEDRFWDAYPRKTDRKKAIASLRRVHRHDRTPFDALLAGCERLRLSGTEIRFLPHATTWLNNERWNDELPDAHPPPRGPGGNGRDRTASTRDHWMANGQRFHENLQGNRHDQCGFDFPGGRPPGSADGGRRDTPAALRERAGGELVQLHPHGDPGRRRALG